MNKNNYAQRHIHNLKKSAGLAGNGAVRYEYILSESELQDTYLNRIDDLGYPLRVEPKRDRYVMNKKALEKAFSDASTQIIKQVEQELYDFINDEVMNLIAQETTALLNTVSFASGQCTVNRRPISRSS